MPLRRRASSLGVLTAAAAATAALLAAAPNTARAIVGRHDTADALYDAFGALPQFAPVGNLFLFGTNPQTGNPFGVGGSGTLITNQWVLTAAHVVDAPGISFGQNTGFTLGGTSRQIAQIVLHPGWNGALENGNDIALVRLASPINNVTPATLFTGTNELTFGATAVNAGFGLKGDGLTGQQTGTSVRRGCENDLDLFGLFTGVGQSLQLGGSLTDGNLLLQDFDNPTPNLTPNTMGSASPREFEGQVGSGDSGGPLLLNTGGSGGATWQVAGVHSFITNPAGIATNPLAAYGWLAGSTRVSNYLGFIAANTGVGSVAPEPGTVALLAFGGVGCLAGVRPGRQQQRRRRGA